MLQMVSIGVPLGNSSHTSVKPTGSGLAERGFPPPTGGCGGLGQVWGEAEVRAGVRAMVM